MEREADPELLEPAADPELLGREAVPEVLERELDPDAGFDRELDPDAGFDRELDPEAAWAREPEPELGLAVDPLLLARRRRVEPLDADEPLLPCEDDRPLDDARLDVPRSVSTDITTSLSEIGIYSAVPLTLWPPAPSEHMFPLLYPVFCSFTHRDPTNGFLRAASSVGHAAHSVPNDVGATLRQPKMTLGSSPREGSMGGRLAADHSPSYVSINSHRVFSPSTD